MYSVRFVRYDLNHFSAPQWMPNVVDKRFNRISLYTVSKAADKSKNAISATSHLSRWLIRSDVTRNRTVSVEWNFVVFFLLTTPTVAWYCDLRNRSLISLPPGPRRRCVDADHRCWSVADHRSWRRFPVGVDHPWWRQPHKSSSNFDLTGPILLLVLSRHFTLLWWSVHWCTLRILNQLFCSFNYYFYLASKASAISNTISWLVQMPWRHTHGLTMMHVELRFLLRICVTVKQLSKHAL